MNESLRDRALTTAAAALGTAAIGVLDYVTGFEIRLFPLYFLPIALAAWRSSRSSALIFAVISAATWLYSNWAAGRIYTPLVGTINFTSQLIAFGVVGYLVAELRQRLRAERNLSRQDSLTALPNSRAFYEQGELLLAVARRSSRPVTLAYLDLDNFKKVNDERGHREGDRALTETAAALRQELRESDFAARVGGDEFAILLPDTALDAARASLERLRGEVAARMQRNAWPISVSIGAVAYVHAPSSLEEALRCADSLLYRAKEGGKDRVWIETDGTYKRPM